MKKILCLLMLAIGMTMTAHAQTPADSMLQYMGGSYEYGMYGPCPYFKLLPTGPGNGRIIFYFPTFLQPDKVSPPLDFKWLSDRLRAAGYTIAGIDVGETYGNPYGQTYFQAFYGTMMQLGYFPQIGVIAVSRGGLMALKWMENYPGQFAHIAAIYPVLDMRDFPGIPVAAQAWGVSEEVLEANIDYYNPITNLPLLVQAGVKAFTIHSENDAVVPLVSNSLEFYDHYVAAGGNIKFMRLYGIGGHDFSPVFWQQQQIIDFLLTY